MDKYYYFIFFKALQNLRSLAPGAFFSASLSTMFSWYKIVQHRSVSCKKLIERDNPKASRLPLLLLTYYYYYYYF